MEYPKCNQKLSMVLEDEPRALNIFCDGSIKKFSDTLTVGCAGAIGYCKDSSVCWCFDYVPAATSNITELMAIYYALCVANSHRNMFDIINIFSDSKLCVYSLTRWIQSWYMCRNEKDILINGIGEAVKNQEYIKTIIRYITDNNLNIRLYHQKGHVTRTEDSLEKARYVFMVSNNLAINNKELIYISKHNAEIDQLTKNRLDYGFPHPELYSVRPIMPLDPVLDDTTMQLYENRLDL